MMMSIPQQKKRRDARKTKSNTWISPRLTSMGFWAHLVMAYVFSFWTCYVLLKEYGIIASMRLHFLATEKRRPDQFTVLVRNVPPDLDESVSELVEHFFLVNHRDHYLTHQVVYDANKLAKLVEEKKKMQNWLDYYQLKYDRNPSKRPTRKTGFLGLCGKKVDAIEFYTSEIERLSNKEATEREKVKKNPKSVLPVAFVSFRTRWGAAVCAQTQQTLRRLIIAVAFFFLTFFFMIPIAFVQSLANIEGIEKAVPFLKHIIEVIPKTIGVSIPMKATFFITYIMVDGWAGIAGEILRLKPLIIYHLKNFFLVKTEKDREEAMDPGSVEFGSSEPQIQLYFLLGLVYAVVTPFLLPFIIIFFGLAYVVFRHQIINVYNQEYESGAAFWPDVHGRIISALIISQLLLLGLLSTKQAAQSTPLLIALPILTIWFHRWLVRCNIRTKGKLENIIVAYTIGGASQHMYIFSVMFLAYQFGLVQIGSKSMQSTCSLAQIIFLPYQEAMMKDTVEQAREPNLDLKTYLLNAYIHPVFKDGEDDDEFSIGEEQEYDNTLVPTKRQSRRNTPAHSKYDGSSSPSQL
ncbi:putative CSC1-like protein [Cocos nucifera]|uniref:Putative CSC1-like protein n=1 Tax=Cocos nucifera TaxID=13894 RepID=A0A8K0IBU4_COCNU|nr:putative CSC1-like protein [Cocos nucifera]